jgi:hypothetical protein
MKPGFKKIPPDSRMKQPIFLHLLESMFSGRTVFWAFLKIGSEKLKSRAEPELDDDDDYDGNINPLNLD